MEAPVIYVCAESMKLIVVRPLLIDCLHALEEAVTLLDIPFATDLSGGSVRSKDARGFVVGDDAEVRLCVHDDLSVGRSTRMIVRIYTGHDGQTHFEDLPLPAEESHNVALQAGANLVFRCFPADYWSDWHTAPRRQYIFILVGQMEIGIGDGTTRRFGPGDVVLADDLTGQGHTTRSLGVPRISATVAVGA